MKNAFRLLVLVSAVLTSYAGQAQSASGYDELSVLGDVFAKEQSVMSPEESPAANSNLSGNLNNKITAMPEFISTRNYKNVNDYIYSNIEFPEEARAMGLYGVVKVQFDIFTDGSIGNLKFIESPDKVFDNEVRKILATLPNWQPAYSGLTPVNSRYQLNIDFSLR